MKKKASMGVKEWWKKCAVKMSMREPEFWDDSITSFAIKLHWPKKYPIKTKFVRINTLSIHGRVDEVIRWNTRGKPIELPFRNWCLEASSVCRKKKFGRWHINLRSRKSSICSQCDNHCDKLGGIFYPRARDTQPLKNVASVHSLSTLYSV